MTSRRASKPAAISRLESFAIRERRRALLFFYLKFGLLIVIFYALQGLGHGGSAYAAYLEANAWVCHLLLDLLGQTTQAADATIFSSTFCMRIKPGCDALEPAWIFAAAVLVSPATAVHRLLGILAGLVVILALNLVRLVTLFLAGRYCPGFFATLHLELWPVALILAAILLFYAWLRWAKGAHAN